TANSHPIPGLTPWYTPSRASVAQGQTAVQLISRVAVRVRRGVASFQVDLVAALLGPDEELRVGAQAAGLAGVPAHQPALDAVGVDLGVPRRVERVAQVDAPAVAAQLDHLRAAVERAGAVQAGPADDAAQPHRAGLARA